MSGGESRRTAVKALAVLSAAGLAAGAALGLGEATVAGARSATPAAASTTVKVKLVEFKVLPALKRVPVGKVTFVVRNAGRIPHELVVLRTSTPGAKLPVKGGKAVEVGKVAAIRTFGPGLTKTLTLRLKAGHYVLLCNLPGHYGSGQFVDFTVGSGPAVGGGGSSTGGGSTGGATTGSGSGTASLDPALVAAGDALYHNGPPGLGYGCNRCHGPAALGDIGPKIVGKDAAAIKQAIGIVSLMQGFGNLTDEQIQQIAAYLQSLQK